MIAETLNEVSLDIEAKRDLIAQRAALDAVLAGLDDEAERIQAWRIHPEDRDLFARADVRVEGRLIRTVVCRACGGVRLGSPDDVRSLPQQHHADGCSTAEEHARRHGARVERFRAYCQGVRWGTGAAR